ncbi:hypothetical protein PR048_020041 [Dryococelus australis]|uniref:DUF4371 domain-containing protein n=1 Tax=Dryococelus australis TaxID=614101 RepID=A0ABQ9H574_9NEOP|nr:hypothetical protein PR048_020041 [Dryococelus australis]
MDKFVFKKPRVEFTENVTSLPDVEASSHSHSPRHLLRAAVSYLVRVKVELFRNHGRHHLAEWNGMIQLKRSHEKTETQKEGLMKLAFSSKKSVAIELHKTLNEDMENARSALMAIYTTLRFLCQQGLSIRGHEDVSSNLIQLLELRREDVPDLKEWMEHSSYKWLSYDIKNEFIDILGKSVLHSDFVGLYETPNTEGKTLFGIVMDILAHLDPNIENLREQFYDGASAISGKFKGLQKFKAIYVHCAAHSLNLAVQDCLRHLPCMRNITNLFKDLIKTVRESPKTVQLYKYIRDNEENGLRPLCPTRWSMRIISMQQVLINYERLAEFFQTYSEEYYSDAASKCAGYLETMQHFRTLFFSNLYCQVVRSVEEVNVKIQCPHIVITEKSHSCPEDDVSQRDLRTLVLQNLTYSSLQKTISDKNMVISCVKDRFNCTRQKLLSEEKECVSSVIAVNNTIPKLEKT